MKCCKKHVLVFLLLEFLPFSQSTIVDKEAFSTTLDNLLEKNSYDKRIRPNYGGGPVNVTVGFWVLSIDSMDVINMDFSIDIFLRQQWVDERLNHGHKNHTLFLSNTVMDRIWLPDSYFLNSKHGSFHRVTTDNIMIMLDPGGVVKYNSRLTIKAACPMDLRNFPMDKQSCPLVLESYGYSRDHIQYKWERDDGDGMKFVPQSVRMLPQYRLTGVNLTILHNVYVVGNWTSIRAMFYFERMYSYFVIHVYGPCGLIVVISWLTFLLPRESPPARVTLGVTCVLTVVTVLNMLNNAMPKVNYVKIIDQYLIGCFLFVFASLVEYALVLFLSSRMKKHKPAKKKWERDKKQDEEYENELLRHRNKSQKKAKKVCSTHLELMAFAESDCSHNVARNGNHHPDPADVHNRSNEPLEYAETIKQRQHLSLKDKVLTESFILGVDECSTLFFPMAFTLFNAIYWFSIREML